MALRGACTRGLGRRLARHGLGQSLVSQRGLPHLAAKAFATEAPPVLRDVRLPSMEEAKSQPIAFCELSNETLLILAEQCCHAACEERLVRNIMVVDGVDWVTANVKMREIKKENLSVLWLATLPYKVGVSVGLVTGFGCVPMIFNRGIAEWFNERFVTQDVPDEKDLETLWEVGLWTWSWMEPPLGTASFVLLALQFVRAQMLNMDWKPYTGWVQNYRATRLSSIYPQYNEDIVGAYARTASLGERAHISHV